MLRRIISLVVILCFSVVSSGCSTLVYGSRQNITVNSEPQGAKVKIGGLRGRTPYAADLSSDRDYIVEVSKEGYETQQVQVVKEFRPVTTILGNIFWLLIGVIVDFASGSAYGLSPDNVDVTLDKK